MFIVCWSEWDSWDFVGLFSTRRKAKAHIKKFSERYAEQCEIIDADVDSPYINPPKPRKTKRKTKR